MIATGLSMPTQSGVGIAAVTVLPMILYEIGQKFKELAKDNPDGKLTEKQQAAHVLAHAILGAAVAAAGDNNALAGALSSGGAEAAAPYISKWLYNKEKGSDLTAEEKETVTAITNLLGTATGAVIGDTTANAAQGSLNAQSAVGNNSLTNDLAMKYAVEISRARTEIERQKIRTNIARDSYTLTYKASTCQTENQCKVILSELQRYFAQFNGIASHYEKTGGPQEKEWAHFLREQQKETLADISRVGRRLSYLADIQTNNKVRNNYLTSNSPSIFKSSNSRVWNDGRFAANLEIEPVHADYYAIHAGPVSTYIPSRDTSNIMIGIPYIESTAPYVFDSSLYKEIAVGVYGYGKDLVNNKTLRLPTTNGIKQSFINYLRSGGVNAGYIIVPSEQTKEELNKVYQTKRNELIQQGVYVPNPKLHHTKEISDIWTKETNDFLPGESTTVSFGYWGGNIKIIRTIDGRWAVETGIGTPDASFSHGTTYRLRKQ